MFDNLSGQGSSPGTDPRDCTAARLNAQRQAIRDIAEWFDEIPLTADSAFCTVTLTFAVSPCTEKPALHGLTAASAMCHWTAAVASAADPVAAPAAKTSAFSPSARFTLLSDQYYEAAGSARGEDINTQEAACAEARKRAHHQAIESAGKAGLCEREGSHMRVAISFAPPAPALLGGGRYGITAFEAVCDWNLIIEAIDPEEPETPDVAGTAASGSLS